MGKSKVIPRFSTAWQGVVLGGVGGDSTLSPMLFKGQPYIFDDVALHFVVKAFPGSR